MRAVPEIAADVARKVMLKERLMKKQYRNVEDVVEAMLYLVALPTGQRAAIEALCAARDAMCEYCRRGEPVINGSHRLQTAPHVRSEDTGVFYVNCHAKPIRDLIANYEVVDYTDNLPEHMQD